MLKANHGIAPIADVIDDHTATCCLGYLLEIHTIKRGVSVQCGQSARSCALQHQARFQRHRMGGPLLRRDCDNLAVLRPDVKDPRLRSKRLFSSRDCPPSRIGQATGRALKFPWFQLPTMGMEQFLHVAVLKEHGAAVKRPSHVYSLRVSSVQ